MAKLFASSGDPDQMLRSFYGSLDYNGLKTYVLDIDVKTIHLKDSVAILLEEKFLQTGSCFPCI